jgi:iron complex transport system substrate-binding protein
MCTDALLLELLPPERIASVTYYSREPSNSYQWPRAAKVRINWGTVEEVLAEKPDLVLAGTYTTPAARAMLKKLHLPLLEVAPVADFDEIRAVTRQVAHALGRDAAGETLIAKMDLTLRELAASRPPQVIRVAAWGEGGSIPGKGTMFDAILRAAGGINIASSGGFMSFDVEQLIIAHPDIIAYASNITDTPGRNTDLAQHPLILKLYARRRVTYPSALYSCGVVESADAAVALRASLLQAMQGGS